MGESGRTLASGGELVPLTPPLFVFMDEALVIIPFPTVGENDLAPSRESCDGTRPLVV